MVENDEIKQPKISIKLFVLLFCILELKDATTRSFFVSYFLKFANIFGFCT